MHFSTDFVEILSGTIVRGANLQRGVNVSFPIFGPCLLWPNGWMHQDATWYRGRPRPKRHCVTWEPSSPPPKRAQPPIFGQTDGRTELRLPKPR